MRHLQLFLETPEDPEANLRATLRADAMVETHKKSGVVVNRVVRVDSLAAGDEIVPFGPGTPVRRILAIERA